MRRFLRRGLVALALVGLAAGTTGDVPSLIERIDGERVYAASEPATTTTSSTVPPTTTTTAPAPPEWTLFAGGDVLMDRSEPAGRNPFAHLVPPLSEADLALVNVEMAVADTGTPQAEKEYTFRAPPSAAQTMAAASVDVANLGNNHALDYGRDALLETIDHLSNAGVAPIGAGADIEEAFRPATFEFGSGDTAVSIAVIGATANVPGGWQVGSLPGIATTRGDLLLESVRAAKAAHDVVVVTVHWGQENAACPDQNQITLGDELIDAGATAVLGHHPHVLQPVLERGGGVIAYSLGNFVWHPRSGPQADTGVLELRFVGATLDGFTFHPHVLDPNGDPEPAGAEATERIETSTGGADCRLAG